MKIILSCVEVLSAFANDPFRPILLVSTIFAIYFAYKKIGYKVLARFSYGKDRFTPLQIKEIVFSNKKDRPVNIYAIHVAFNKELWLKLESCHPPKVLKPFESMSFEIAPYSRAYVGDDCYEPHFEDAVIYIESDEKMIRCKSLYRQESRLREPKVSVERFSFDGFVYGDDVAFILSYELNGGMKTAFIDRHGGIGNEWEFSQRFLGCEVTEEAIAGMLKSRGFNRIFRTCELYKVTGHGGVEFVTEIAGQRGLVV